MNDAHAVELFQGQNEVGQVKFGTLLIKVALFFKQVPEVSPACILQDEEVKVFV